MGRRFLMCPPTHFDVTYAINPWMSSGLAVDRAAAMAQWEHLKALYERLGHEVEVVEPVEGLPDMVFTANAGTPIAGRVLPARFRHDERTAEEPAFRRWFQDHGYDIVGGDDVPVNEGQGDLLVAGDLLLSGTGFRTDPAARDLAQEVFGLAAVQLRLVDARYYHLDTALAVLGDRTIAYLPSAFSPGSRRVLGRLFPDAILATDADGAPRLADQLAARGYVPHPVDMSELIRAGGAVKCCTLVLSEPAQEA